MDRLETILNKQRALQERLGLDLPNMSDKERADYMRNQRGYLADEIAEALYEMPFYKQWKDYSKMTEEDKVYAWQKVRMELVDSLHFFVNLLIGAGFTADELYQMYTAKNKENNRRQDVGYDSATSYRDQPVADVMANTSDALVSVRSADDRLLVSVTTDIRMFGLIVCVLQDTYQAHLNQMSEEEANDVSEQVLQAFEEVRHEQN